MLLGSGQRSNFLVATKQRESIFIWYSQILCSLLCADCTLHFSSKLPNVYTISGGHFVPGILESHNV